MNNSINFLQVVELTDEEKFDMYMKVPHEELVRMKIEEEKYVKMMENVRCCKYPCKDRTIFTTYNSTLSNEPFSKEQLSYLNSHFQRKPNYMGGPG